MKDGFRQSMAWLHTWTGLLVGWLLLLIFMAGTASYYRDEIGRWTRPELPRAQVAPEAALARALGYLERHAAGAELWNVALPTPRTPQLTMFWRNPAPADGRPVGRRERFGNALVDPVTGEEVAARDTRGGDFFYRLHFDLHYIPVMWARWLVGFCAMFMLVAIVTGVITHKKIFVDFFTFRPGKGQRSWLDFHNASAVLALPYHAMITYTGVVTLMFMYLPWAIDAAYPQGSDRFFEEALDGAVQVREAAGAPGALPDPARLLEAARAAWPDRSPGRVIVHHPGDANAVAVVQPGIDGRLSVRAPSLVLDAASGEVLARSAPPGGASQTHGVMYGLHLGRFAGPGLRLLLFGSGLLGCLMVASGLVLWAVKRRPQHLKAGRIGFGLRLVEALNIGSVGGLPIAFAAFFWANRLVPLDAAERASQEVRVFFAAWALALVAALVRPVRAMWAWQLYAGAALFALLPLLNALTTQAHLGRTLPAGDWGLAGVDLACLGLGLALGVAGRRMQRWQPAPTAAQKRALQAAAAGGRTA